MTDTPLGQISLMQHGSNLTINTRQGLIDSLEGDSDLEYLKEHFPRFLRTRQLSWRRWDWDCADVLDVGAHWLHQSVLFATQGHHVTALDRPETLQCAGVKLTARRHNISLMEIDDLATPAELEHITDNSIDVILFCEILEHLTFNPMPMWRGLYRVLKPGGRIIVTTPNCYGSANLIRALFRKIKREGTGISVDDIIQMPTSRPHWKEYSLRELKRYFTLISADFQIGRASHVNFVNGASTRWQRRALNQLERMIPGLRNGLYLEIDLPLKSAGVRPV